MILFGYPIHRKYSKKIFKFCVYVFAIVVFLLLISCSKYEFDGFDPTTSTGAPVGGGFDQGFYPNPRTYSFGINLKF